MGQQENKRYQQKVKEASPKSPSWKNCFWAFAIGGAICVIGQVLGQIFQSTGMEKETKY